MTWVGRTKFSQIGVGTSFRLEHVPTDPEHTPSQVQAGSELAIEMAGDVRTKATILSVADNEIELKMPNGAVWRMTHLTPLDPPVHITSPGLSHQDWVIRSARPFTPPKSASQTGGESSSRPERRRAAEAEKGGKAVKIGTALLIGVGLGWLLVGQRRAASTRSIAPDVGPDGRSLDERFNELARDRSEEIVGAARLP